MSSRTVHVEHVMGTAVSFDVPGTGTDGAVEAVVEWLHHVNDSYSVFDPNTPASRYSAGELFGEDITEEFFEVLALCAQARAETGGVFDPWSIPAASGTRFDPSGVVKGWAVERAAGIMERHGCSAFSINAGGDVVVRGTQPEGDRWTVGIQHPFNQASICGVVELPERGGIATSGLYERGGHVVELDRGRPADGAVSATVWGPSLVVADVWATTLLITGEAGLERLFERHADYDVFLVLDDERTLTTASQVGETSRKSL